MTPDYHRVMWLQVLPSAFPSDAFALLSWRPPSRYLDGSSEWGKLGWFKQSCKLNLIPSRRFVSHLFRFKGLSSVLIRLVCSCITWQHQEGVVMILFSSRCLSSTGDRAKETHKFILKYFRGCVRASVSCQPPSHLQCGGCACSLAHTSADSSSLISSIPSTHWLAGTYVFQVTSFIRHPPLA